MPRENRAARDRSDLPATEAAALAALAVSESLVLAMVESGCLDPQVLRRCLLDAATAHDKHGARHHGNASVAQTVHAETARVIENLLRQVEAVAPSRAPVDSQGKASSGEI